MYYKILLSLLIKKNEINKEIKNNIGIITFIYEKNITTYENLKEQLINNEYMAYGSNNLISSSKFLGSGNNLTSSFGYNTTVKFKENIDVVFSLG